MDIVEISSIKNLVLGSIIIGAGKTAVCFKMKDGNVFKCYLNTHLKNELFRLKGDMLEHLKKLSELKNDTYRAPEKIVIKDNQVIGYIYPYIKAKTINNMSVNTKILDSIKEYDKLLSDTKEVSDKDFKLGDIHTKNILYNEMFYIIDLDFSSYIKTHSEIYNNYYFNMNLIMRTYLEKIFKVNKETEILKFNDSKLAEMFRNMNWTNIDEVYNFFENIVQLTNKTNPSILDVRKSHLVTKEENTYYRAF